MNFDMVFDIQHAYRQVVHAFAYPGEIVSLKQEADRLEAELPCRAATGVLLYMLLDADTSFHAVEEEQLTDIIARLAYCQSGSLETAGNVIGTGKHRDRLCEIMQKVQTGTLEDPHLGATLLVECDSLQEGDELILRGPGIPHAHTIASPLNSDWVEVRALVNEEFPLGFDMLLIDADANCMALPRTTQVERG